MRREQPNLALQVSKGFIRWRHSCWWLSEIAEIEISKDFLLVLRMKLLLAATACLVAGTACAKDFSVAARSGQPALMHVYRSWTKDCKSKLGIVKVLTKPSHGTLRPSQVTSTIGTSRRNPEKTAHCKGVATNGFRVDYTSVPGFRGTDQFTIQFTFGRTIDIDNYTVTVR